MSLVAGLLLGANLYAIDNVKVSGNAKLFYGTQSDTTTGAADIFDKEASYADFGVSLGVTADIIENVTAGATFQVMSTLGMQDSIADDPWSSSHTGSNGSLETTEWISEAWLAGTYGKTTATVGRQMLETPLVFSETWSVEANTFEAGVLVNEDIPDTTLIGMWVGKSNGFASDPSAPVNGSITSSGAQFNTFGTDGAFIIGATNNSFKPVTAQAWYYDMPNTAEAIWAQVDMDMEGVLAGAQYTTIDRTGEADEDTAYGLMLGYAMKDSVTIKAAYSSVDDKGSAGGEGVGNMATTGQNAGQASSLYTEMWWWFNTVSATGADSWNVSVEGSVSDTDLFLGYYSSESDTVEVDEIAFTASRSYGDLDTSIALIHDMFGDTTNEDLTTLQVYLTYNF